MIDVRRRGVVCRKFRLSSQQAAAEISPKGKLASPRAGQKMGSLERVVSAGRIARKGDTHEFLGGDDVKDASEHVTIAPRSAVWRHC